MPLAPNADKALLDSAGGGRLVTVAEALADAPADDALPEAEVELVVELEVDEGAGAVPGALTSKSGLVAKTWLWFCGLTNWTSKPEPTFKVTLVTVNDSVEVSTNWAIENGPFKVALSALTTRMSTGDGSPEVNCQLMVLLVFCTQ